MQACAAPCKQCKPRNARRQTEGMRPGQYEPDLGELLDNTLGVG